MIPLDANGDGANGFNRNGRNPANGRFTQGHSFSKGNPHAKRVQQLRGALLSVVTEEDMVSVAKLLVEMAKGGNLIAIRELLDRSIGKPVSSLELTGADGEPLGIMNLQATILDALAGFPEAKIEVAKRLRNMARDD